MKMKPGSKPWIAAIRMGLFSLIPVFGLLQFANAQSFSSGSDGSDGPLDAATLGVTTTPVTVVFNPAGFPGDQHNLNIFNFTTINIPTGVTVRLTSTKINGPVIWLASGNVDIEGTIDLSGQAGVAVSPILDGRRRAVDAGAGGYDGGIGGKSDGSTVSASEPLSLSGDGPGGGAGATYNKNLGPEVGYGGTFSGNSLLVPLVGGSGGGGGLLNGSLGSTPYGASGGAGGGALLIASSTSVTVNGTINANGGQGGGGGGNYNSYDAIGFGGGGSGGGIRLAANTLAGSGNLTAAGGAGGGLACNNNCNYSFGGNGVVRLEAFTDTFTGTVNGTQSMAEPIATYLPTIEPPSVSVVSVNSTNLPTSPTGSLSAPDVTIDTTSAVTITVQTTNIPPGTVLTLHVFSDNNTDQTVKTTALAGTLASSTATANVTFPSGYALNYVKATWTTTN